LNRAETLEDISGEEAFTLTGAVTTIGAAAGEVETAVAGRLEAELRSAAGAATGAATGGGAATAAGAA
jgi:hypothetical protein